MDLLQKREECHGNSDLRGIKIIKITRFKNITDFKSGSGSNSFDKNGTHNI